MKSIYRLSLIVIVFCFTSSFAQSDDNNQTTYYFIRHAEKQRTENVGNNPSLNTDGIKRSKSWKSYFSNVDFDAIYSTNYNRTLETAQPTADAKNLEINIYDPKDMYSEKFQYDTKGKTVLVVGHSNTTPIFVNKILGEEFYQQIEDDNNSNLYIVEIIDGVINHRLITVD